MKGLIIDDDKSMLLSTKMILERNGHKIDILSSPLYALAIASSSKPDFIIVDGHFGPGMEDGIELAKTLKGYKVGMHSGDPDMEKRAKEIGIPFLMKASAPSELIDFPNKIVNQ